jgi:prepilin-type N-terminal cleavage/methylation domain-containing protein
MMKTSRRHSTPRSPRQGFSLLEVLVGLSILSAGLLAIMAIFPYTLKGQRQAELLTEAVALAQMKAEEIRRDDSKSKKLVKAIQAMDQPSDPIAFPTEPRLTYSFCGRSLLYGTDSADPRGASNVARVIIRYAPGLKQEQGVLYELRFN